MSRKKATNPTPANDPDGEPRFPEESMAPLTDRDRDRFLEVLDAPPEANDALRVAAKRLANPPE